MIIDEAARPPARPPAAAAGEARLWRRFLRLVLLTAAAAVAAVYAVVLLVDPYDCLWFSPRLGRAPVAASQRYAFPAVARSPAFDSLVLGTSVARQLQPPDLDAALGGRFANLAMDAATPYEQSRLLDVFLQAHAAPKTVIIATDVQWCRPDRPFEVTFDDRFPEWLYDGGRWSKLGTVLSSTAITDTARQLLWLLHLRPAVRAMNGFAPIAPASEYNPDRARWRLYDGQPPHAVEPQSPPFAPSEDLLQRWTFPDHARLRAMLAALPAATRKIVVFTPTHVFSQGAPGSVTALQWRLCKQSVARIAAAAPNAYALDFMIPSVITRRDENYWDPLHYRLETATQLAALMADGVRRRASLPDYFDYLAGPDAAAADAGQSQTPPP